MLAGYSPSYFVILPTFKSTIAGTLKFSTKKIQFSGTTVQSKSGTTGKVSQTKWVWNLWIIKKCAMDKLGGFVAEVFLLPIFLINLETRRLHRIINSVDISVLGFNFPRPRTRAGSLIQSFLSPSKTTTVFLNTQ